MVFAWEQGLALQHLRKDTTGTPNIDLDVVLLPGEHDLGCPIVSCRHITCHLRILYTCKSEVAYLQVAVLVD